MFEREFTAIKPISIDYAVMEHATDVAVIEAPFEWDDLGGWQSLARLAGSDENGNTIVGRHLGLDTTGTIVRTDDDHLVVTLGLKDCIVVHTPNATLVANKHDEEQIRQVVKELEKRGLGREYLSDRQSNPTAYRRDRLRHGADWRRAGRYGGPHRRAVRELHAADAGTRRRVFRAARQGGADRPLCRRPAGAFGRQRGAEVAWRRARLASGWAR